MRRTCLPMTVEISRKSRSHTVHEVEPSQYFLLWVVDFFFLFSFFVSKDAVRIEFNRTYVVPTRLDIMRL